MNEEQVKDLMRKVLQADQIIHEQQLGLSWKAPLADLHYFGLDGDVNLKGPLKRLENGTVSGEQQSSVNAFTALKLPLLASQEKLENFGADSLDAPKLLGEKVQASQYQGFSTPVKRILDLLCAEGGFLVEDKLNKLLTPLQSDERSLMKLDAIFKALGIETLEDVQRMTGYFMKPNASLPPNADLSNPSTYDNLLIPCDEVVRAMKKFLEDTWYTMKYLYLKNKYL